MPAAFTSNMTADVFIGCTTLIIVELIYCSDNYKARKIIKGIENQRAELAKRWQTTEALNAALMDDVNSLKDLCATAKTPNDRANCKALESKLSTRKTKLVKMMCKIALQDTALAVKWLRHEKQNTYPTLLEQNTKHIDEYLAPRRWKKTVVEHWNPIRFAIFYRKVAGTAKSIPVPRTHPKTSYAENNKIAMKLMRFIPEAVDDIMELVRSRLQRECPDKVDVEPPIVVTQSSSTNSIFAHALIKKNRYTFEYVVDDSDTVNAMIGERHAIFHESLENFDPDYLTTIHKKMVKIVGAETKNGISFTDHTFVYKKRAIADFASIIHVYRTAHK